jgi:HK97 gp10 family phage protein
MPDVTIKISGLDELEQRLTDLAPKMAKKVIRKAGKAGGEIIRSAIAARAPRLTGNLDQHIVMTTRADGSKGTLVVVIGPQKLAGYFKGATREGKNVTFKGEIHYADVAARMAEFGSKHQPPRPFMGPAFDSSADQALGAFVNSLSDSLSDLAE